MPSCRAEVGYEYLGGDLIGADGQPVKYENTATPQECCQVGQERFCLGCAGWDPLPG